MAAPTPSTRSARVPAGIKLKDGYQTLITFAADLDVSFWEKTVKPPGVDGGDAIDQTTMHNSTYRVMRSRALKTLTESSGKAAYDPEVTSDIISLINVETTITIHFPDTTTIAFYGFLKSVEFDELAEGTQPELTYTVVCTNWDTTNNVEAGPAVSSAEGT